MGKEKYISFIWAGLLAALTSIGYLFVSWNEDKVINENESLQLLKLSDNFNHTYSLVRTDDMPVPATFRRMGIENFNAQIHLGGESDHTRMLWPGRPGLAMNRTTDNPRLREIINSYVKNPQAAPIYEQFFADKRLVGRTVLPSIAHDESCVNCHNTALKKQVYQVGDVLGIQVVERDMTDLLLTDVKYAGGVFVLTFVLSSIFAMRERIRNRNIMRLKSRIAMARMKAENEERKKFLLSHDPLTGLPNRKLFHDFLDAAVQGDERGQLHIALIDLDDFKGVNDTMGHAAGDALLVEVAKRLKQALDGREGLAARLGGDEFVLVWFGGDTKQESGHFASQVLAEVTVPMTFEHSSIAPKCSIGVATWRDVESGDPYDMVKLADIALYAAKEAGKNTYQVYDRSISSNILRTNEIAAYLTESIRRDDLTVVLQPQVSLADGCFMGFEAFSRWTLNGTEIPTVEFVSIAESIGMIHELDLKTLAQAAKFSADLERRVGQAIPISVNLSAHSLQSPSLFDDIQRILHDTGLSARCLTIEISETLAVQDWDQVQAALNQLRDLGVRLSLDEFGSGYLYLTKMKFNQIKLSPDFIRKITTDNSYHELLLHISNIAADLKVELVVKGVESDEQFNMARKSVSGGAQGYYFSAPLPLDAAMNYLEDKVACECRASG